MQYCNARLIKCESLTLRAAMGRDTVDAHWPCLAALMGIVNRMGLNHTIGVGKIMQSTVSPASSVMAPSGLALGCGGTLDCM